MSDPRQPIDPDDAEDAREDEDEGLYELVETPPPEPGPAAASPSPYRPLPPPTAAGIACMNCRYDLSGTPLGGNCPECGTPVASTIRQLQRRQGEDATSGAALTCLVLGALSIPCCSLLGPIAVIYYVKAQSEIKESGPGGGSQTLAVVGLVLGLIGTLRMVVEAIMVTLRMF